MEIIFALFAMISFIACVYAYLTGVNHGMRVSVRSVPKPIKEVIDSAKNTVKKEDEVVDDIISQMLNYDYDAALKATEQMRIRGER